MSLPPNSYVEVLTSHVMVLGGGDFGKWLGYEARTHVSELRALIKRPQRWSSHCGSVETNLTSIHKNTGSIPGLAQWVKGSSVAVSCGVGHRHGSDLALLWLWCRLAATAPIEPLAWAPPHASGAALKRQKKKKKERSQRAVSSLQPCKETVCKRLPLALAQGASADTKCACALTFDFSASRAMRRKKKFLWFIGHFVLVFYYGSLGVLLW